MCLHVCDLSTDVLALDDFSGLKKKKKKKKKPFEMDGLEESLQVGSACSFLVIMPTVRPASNVPSTRAYSQRCKFFTHVSIFLHIHEADLETRK